MNQADRDLLIEVRVDLRGGDFEVSTGYPVAPDLVLTARHGLFPKNRKNEIIHLRWFHQRAGKGQPMVKVSRSAIAWDDEELDVALVRCDFPEGLETAWRHLSPIRPYHGESWASEGFPLGADGVDGSTDAFPMAGTLHAAATHANRFHLDLPPTFREPTHWGGISGAPVFARGQIVGVIVSTPELGQGRLKAVLSSSLFADEHCAAVIPYSSTDGGAAALRTATIQCLTQSELACHYLAGVLSTRNDAPSTLADSLIGLASGGAVIAVVKQAHKLAYDAKERKASEVLRRLLLTLLPGRLDPQAIEGARMHLRSDGKTVIPVDVCTNTGAELLMAALDTQPAAYREDGGWNDAPGIPRYPDGIYSIDPPPKRGMADEVDDSIFLRDWIRHLINRFASGPGFYGRSDKARIKIAARRLAPTDERPRAYYVLIDEVAGAQDPDAAERRAGLIQGSCPSIVFLRLVGSDDRLIEETELLDPFCELLSATREASS